MSQDDLIDLSLGAISELIRERTVSPVEVTEAIVESVERQNPTLHAFISVIAGEAMEAAHHAQAMLAAGDVRGPLQGIPLGIKDNIDTRGLATTAGSRILAEHVPQRDATVVSKLRLGGAVIVGKTNLHEFGWGGTGENPHYGTSRNPWNPTRSTGGSSGGSAAAVAARMCFGALGTDTDGSIRAPSAFNGVVGLRPTMGRVSNDGVIPLAWSMDTVGPIARTARDCWMMLGVMAGDPRAVGPTELGNRGIPRWDEGVKGLRLGIDDDYSFGGTQVDVEAAVRSAVTRLEGEGARVIPIRCDDMNVNPAAELTVIGAEASSYHQRWLRARPDDYGDDVRLQLEAGELYLATHYIQAQRYRTLLRQSVLNVLKGVDVIVSPTVGFTAVPIGETRVRVHEKSVDAMTAVMRHTGLASLTGLPAVSVPCGFATDGLPMGMQLLGRPNCEHVLLQVADAYQRMTDWHQQAPRAARASNSGKNR
jgi:aspartyl-tRNA(Asn)/glutamyl-tRNA(Gln) amidotransferase subunit A